MRFMDTTPHSLLASTDVVLTSHDLLTLLPIGTAAVLASRMILGLKTIGIFAPALLALTIYQLGARETGAALLVTLGAALMISPLLDAMALPRPSRLAALVVAVLTALIATGVVADSSSAAPIVVLAIVMERTWDVAHSSTARDAIRLFAASVGLAFAVAALLAEAAVRTTGWHWSTAAAVGFAANVLISRYRGLRLSELARFRPVFVGAAHETQAVR